MIDDGERRILYENDENIILWDNSSKKQIVNFVKCSFPFLSRIHYSRNAFEFNTEIATLIFDLKMKTNVSFELIALISQSTKIYFALVKKEVE